MTYEEAKKEIAIKHKLGTTLVTGHKASYFEEAALLYADQIKVKNLAQPDVTSSAKPKVTVGGWGTINCSHCGKQNVGGIITMWIDDTPDQAEICNLCLKEHYEEVK